MAEGAGRPHSSAIGVPLRVMRGVSDRLAMQVHQSVVAPDGAMGTAGYTLRSPGSPEYRRDRTY